MTQVTEDFLERIKVALNAGHRLEHAKPKVAPEHHAALEVVCDQVAKEQYRSAKAGLTDLLVKLDEAPDDMWIAMSYILIALGETDARPLLEYIRANK